MATINKRVTANPEGEFVVFLIGMRINKLWKVHKWFPVVMAMPKMLRELAQSPESGFLGAHNFAAWRRPMVLQYWRSFEDLERYARSRDAEHWPAWVAFNKKVGSGGDVGIWHETYTIGPGQWECIYNNMTEFGLGKAFGLVPAAGRKTTAAARLGVREDADYPEGAPLPTP